MQQFLRLSSLPRRMWFLALRDKKKCTYLRWWFFQLLDPWFSDTWSSKLLYVRICLTRMRKSCVSSRVLRVIAFLLLTKVSSHLSMKLKKGVDSWTSAASASLCSLLSNAFELEKFKNSIKDKLKEVFSNL